MDPKREAPSSETQTPIMSSHKATHAILNTHELLHDILARLPVKDIVVATGVCQTWHKLKDNVAIQKAMFLSPVDISDIETDTDLCLSTRLEDIFRGQYSVVGKTHDALAAFSSGDKVFLSEKGVHYTTFLQNFRSKPLFQHPLGCWRDMFTSQPPTTVVSIALLPFGSPCSKKEYFECNTGVKMGELADFCDIVLRLNGWSSGCRAEPEGFVDLEDHQDLVRGGRWDVREGKIYRQTQLPSDSSD